MKTLYLHIGTPKTATSSIQKFLAQNREVLESKGYVFPKSLHHVSRSHSPASDLCILPEDVNYPCC